MGEAQTIDEQPRLAIFISGMYGGGAQRSILKLAKGIAKAGYPIDLVLAKAEGPFLKEIPDDVRLVDLEAPRVLSSIPALIRYLRRERPTAMLTALDYVNIIAVCARRLAGVSTRLIVSERNNLSQSAQHKQSRHGRFMPRLIKFFYPFADGIVAVSKGVANDLAQVTGLPRQKIEAIYNPIVTPELHEKTQDTLDHPWFKPGQPPVILAVGRLTKQKDFPTLIKAFAQVRQNHQARLMILGEGDDRPTLEALAEELGVETDVCLPGFVINPYPYMVQASLFVLSSRWEGLPGVLIEALYCGTPLVSTDCPSGPREILADGQYGQLVPVGDVEAMAQAIATTLTQQDTELLSESWRPFELDHVVNQYLAILLKS